MTFASELLAKPPHRNPNSLFIKETGCVGAVVVNALSQLEDHRLVTEAIRETISRLFASVPQKNAGRAALPLGRRSSQLCEMTDRVLASL